MFEDEKRLLEPRRRRRALLDLNIALTRRLEAANRDLTPAERVEYESRGHEIDRIFREEIDPIVMRLARELDARIAARKAPTVEAIRQAIKTFSEEARLVAFHESGHAVLSILEGRGTEKMEMVFHRVGGTLKPGGGLHYPRRGPTSNVASMAGIAAEQIEFNGKPPILSAAVDGPLPGWDRSLSGDLDALSEQYAATHQSGSLKTLAREDIAEARSILLRSWPSVVAVAQGLLKTGYLDGDTAEKIAIDAMPAHQRNDARGKLQQAAWDDRQRKARAS